MPERKLKVFSIIPGREEDKNIMIFARNQIKDLEDLGVDNQTFFLDDRKSPWRLLLQWLEAQKRVKHFRPDIIHIHYGTITGFFGSLLWGAPKVISFRGSDLNPDPSSMQLLKYPGHLLSQFAAWRSTCRFFVTAKLSERVWSRNKPMIVIPSGINLDIFYPRDRDEACQRLGLDSKKRYLLFNAGNNPILKRLDLAEMVYQRISREYENVELIVLKGQASFTDMPYYHAVADVLLVTSEFEGSPNIVKEAMACGLPVVSFDVGDVSELLENSEKSVVIPERDIDRMIVAANRLMATPQREKSHAILDKINNKKIAQKILKAYNAVAQESS